MTTDPHLDAALADQLDELTAQQRSAHDMTAAQREQLAAARQRLELLEVGLAELRRQMTPTDRPAAPADGDPRGVVPVVVTGRAGRHTCNQPSTGRALLGGERVDVTA